jgi:hypothetical protein
VTASPDLGFIARRVEAEMATRGLSPNDVYKESRVDPKTLRKVLDGEKVQGDSQRRLAAYFGWADDAFARMGRGEEPIPLAGLSGDRVDRLLDALENVVTRLEAVADELGPER